jgi:large subunit ribosomal protein L17
MRHGKSGKKLGRTSSHRKAMLRNMVTSLFKYEKIQTTDSKAKELRKVADKMVTLGKRGDLHARRQAASYVRDSEVVGKLFSDLSERFRERSGGYTRIVKTGYRVGDNAPMSIVELTAEVKKVKAKTKGKKKAAAAA